ncbi:hypothetical protein AB0A63_21445 [Lentzea sp. NPDC042327]|uniref:Imm32 family immunity protein n=1 Tax=Lentzea sp. NPDC042327 TaxID=3154801 RepID=UPI0033ECBAD4
MAVVLRCSSRTREVDLSGSRGSVAQAADLFFCTGGRVETELTDPAPYETCLRALEVRVTGGEVVVDVVDQELVVSGGAEHLAVLGEVLRDLAEEADFDHHVHVDHFPGHHHLAEESWPLVVQVTEA